MFGGSSQLNFLMLAEESSIADLKERLKNKEEELRLTEDKFESLEAAMHEKAASLEDLSERAEEDELVVKEWESKSRAFLFSLKTKTTADLSSSFHVLLLQNAPMNLRHKLMSRKQSWKNRRMKPAMLFQNGRNAARNLRKRKMSFLDLWKQHSSVARMLLTKMTLWSRRPMSNYQNQWMH